MKRLIFIVFSVVAALSGCNPHDSQLEMLSEQHERFADFLTEETHKLQNLNAETNKDDFFRSFERKAFGFFDSFGILHQWCGEIKIIKKNETSFSKTITFSVECPIRHSATMVFHCNYAISKDSLAVDPLFAKLDSLRSGENVAFDAVVMTRNNGSLRYHNGALHDERNITSPHYRMYVVDIEDYNEARSVPIFNDLQEAIVATYALVEPDRLNYLGKLTEQAREARVSVAEQVYFDSLEPLDPDDRRYIERLRRALTYNYRYGD